VVETDVHYPTDINLLFDAMRKIITLVAGVCDELGLSLWRQSAYNERKLKRLYRRAQSLKRSKARKKERVEARNATIAEAHQEYTDRAEAYLQKAAAALDLFSTKGVEAITCMAIEHYMAHAVRQIDQIRRRVLEGERIPHGEMSVFDLRRAYGVDQQRQGRKEPGAGTEGLRGRGSVWIPAHPPGDEENRRRGSGDGFDEGDKGEIPAVA
jgi:hypothetical protein